MIQQFMVTVPLPVVISANHRLHHHERARRTKQIIEIVRRSARHLEPVEAATVWGAVTKATARSYDVQNLQPTVKAIVDALVRTPLSVLPDDDNAHVMGPWLYHKGIDRGLAKKNALQPERVRFTITLTDYRPDTIPF